MLEKLIKDIQKFDDKNIIFLYFLFKKEMEERGLL